MATLKLLIVKIPPEEEPGAIQEVVRVVRERQDVDVEQIRSILGTILTDCGGDDEIWFSPQSVVDNWGQFPPGAELEAIVLTR